MPMGYYYGYDYTWYLLVLPAFLLALWAQFRVKATYSKYSKVRSVRGRTAAEVARQILNDHGLSYVQVDQIGGELTDNYDPRTNIVHLSQGVYSSTSIAAIGVAAHECGHAVQHAEDEAALRAAVEQIREKRRSEQEGQDDAKEQSDGEHTGGSVESAKIYGLSVNHQNVDQLINAIEKIGSIERKKINIDCRNVVEKYLKLYMSK